MQSLPKTVVIGLGPTGLSCVQYLLKKGYPVAVTDSREKPPGLSELQQHFPNVPVAVGGFSETFLLAAEQLVVSPGVSCHEPIITAQVEKGVPVIGDVELFARDNTRPVIAITGSNVKMCFVLYLASYIDRHEEQIQARFNGLIKPLVILGIVGILLLMEPDFGSLAVLSMTALMMLFLAGVRLFPFVGLFSVMVVAMSSLAIFTPYRLKRLTTFLNPWLNPFGSGYQLTQSLIAFGRGGLFG